MAVYKLWDDLRITKAKNGLGSLRLSTTQMSTTVVQIHNSAWPTLLQILAEVIILQLLVKLMAQTARTITQISRDALLEEISGSTCVCAFV